LIFAKPEPDNREMASPTLVGGSDVRRNSKPAAQKGQETHVGLEAGFCLPAGGVVATERRL